MSEVLGHAALPRPVPVSDGRSRALADVRLGLRILGREWRGGELRILILALLVAVAGITSVAFFVDRVERAMSSRASELLAADLLVNSRDPIAPSFAAKADAHALELARTLTFRSVVLSGERMRLTEVKAVTDSYPLRGTLRIADTAFGQSRNTGESVEPGTVWLEGRLLAALGLGVGDSIELGQSQLRIARVLTYEPDRGGDLFSIAPRVLMHIDDVSDTGLVQAGSRVRHRLLVAGTRDDVARYRTAIATDVPVNARIEGVQDARPELRNALERARQFLGLAALVGVLLAGAAIAVSARRHAERHLDAAALLRCFGASQASVLRIYGVQLLAVAVAGGLIGALLGFLAQLGLAGILGAMVVDILPAPGPTPVAVGLAVAVATLVGFGLPPMLRLRNVSPARVLRRDLDATTWRAWTVYLAGFIALFGIAWWQAGYMQLAAMVMAGAAGTMAVLAVGAFLMLRVLTLLRGRTGPAVRFAVAGVLRRPAASVLQMVAFGLGLMALLLLGLVRGEMLDEWRRSLPPDAPNFFLINVQPDEVQALEALLEREQLKIQTLSPMVRGRLTSINGEAVVADSYVEPRAQRLATREANLSFAGEQPVHNALTAGRWWRDGEAGWSIEAGIANTLGIEIGDVLRFRIAGLDVEGPVLSVRAVKWDDFNVNFFYLASPALLDGYPATYITSFHLDPSRRELLAEMVRQFPSVTVIDVDALMRQVRGIMDHATLGIEYVFGFTILAGLMVLFATIHSTLDERRHETAILRTLGAQRRMLVSGLVIEFALLGGLAGLLAAGTATISAAVLAQQVFGFEFDGSIWTWLVGAGGGAWLIASAGYLSTRRVIDQPPVDSLRQLG
ncbi:MAG: FtsX-like permease family protein [Pseudomonadota bacterium]